MFSLLPDIVRPRLQLISARTFSKVSSVQKLDIAQSSLKQGLGTASFIDAIMHQFCAHALPTYFCTLQYIVFLDKISLISLYITL